MLSCTLFSYISSNLHPTLVDTDQHTQINDFVESVSTKELKQLVCIAEENDL